MSEDRMQIKTPSSAESTFRDFYAVDSNFGHVGIEIDENTGRLCYRVIEPTIEESEKWILNELEDYILNRMDIPLYHLDDNSSLEKYLEENADLVFDRLKKNVALESEEKYLYFLKRDFLGYGKINVLMLDEFIEDISFFDPGRRYFLSGQYICF